MRSRGRAKPILENIWDFSWIHADSILATVQTLTLLQKYKCCHPEGIQKPTALQASSQQYKPEATISKPFLSQPDQLQISLSHISPPKAMQFPRPIAVPLHARLPVIIITSSQQNQRPALLHWRSALAKVQSWCMKQEFLLSATKCYFWLVRRAFGPRLRVTNGAQTHYPCNLPFSYKFPYKQNMEHWKGFKTSCFRGIPGGSLSSPFPLFPSGLNSSYQGLGLRFAYSHGCAVLALAGTETARCSHAGVSASKHGLLIHFSKSKVCSLKVNNFPTSDRQKRVLGFAENC